MWQICANAHPKIRQLGMRLRQLILQADLWISRAPGRLDVMGGISDYSGSLVLQMPIAEACHVAAQTHPPSSDLQLWQHITHRHVRQPFILNLPHFCRVFDRMRPNTYFVGP